MPRHRSVPHQFFTPLSRPFTSLSLSDSQTFKILLSSTKPCCTWDTSVDSPWPWLQLEASKAHTTTTGSACWPDLLLSLGLCFFALSSPAVAKLLGCTATPPFLVMLLTIYTTIGLNITIIHFHHLGLAVFQCSVLF